MANCINDIILNISTINSCGVGLGGLKQCYIATYDSTVFTNMIITNGQIINLGNNIKFSELEFDRTVSFFAFKPDFINDAYQLALTLQLKIVDPDKRTAIDALVKADLIFLIQDMNNKWFLLGEKTGISCSDMNATTDTFKNKSVYNFTYTCKSDYLPYSVDTNLISFITSIDCSELDRWRFLYSQDLYWYKFRNCIVNGII